MESNHDNGIWDEHKWESHINEIEQKNNQWRVFLENTIGDENPRWYRILKQSDSEQDALDTYIEEELLFDEAYFPDDDDDWDLDDDEDDDLIFGFGDDEEDDEIEDFTDLDESDFDDDDLLDDEMGFLEEGEEWKLLSHEFATTNYGTIENLNIYVQAHELGILVLKMAEENHKLHLNTMYNQFVSDVLQISTKIAAGYSLGFEIDMLGGNIAYNKKALDAANRALISLQSLKSKGVFPDAESYYLLHRNLSKLRNETGVYVQELRERFRDDLNS